MRILIFTKQIGHYHNARFCGASKYFGHVTVASVANEGEFPEFRASVFGDYSIINLYSSKKKYEEAHKANAIKELVERVICSEKPDVVAVSGWASPESYAAIRWCAKKNVPVVMMSESQIDDAKRIKHREYIKKRILNLCDAALVGGSPHARYIESLGMQPDDIYYGYNAVDNDHFRVGARAARDNEINLREQYRLPRKYLLASSRFIHKKNLLVLIRAYARAVCKIEGMPDLVLLGDGYLKEKILIEVENANLSDSIHLLGFKSYEDLPVFYGLAEAFIHIATHEQWGLVINEAMASEVLVLVSEQCGASRVLINDSNGGVSIKSDLDNVVDGLIRVLSLSDEDKLKLIKNNASTIAKWGVDRFGQGLHSAAEKAVSNIAKKKFKFSDRLLLGYIEKLNIKNVF